MADGSWKSIEDVVVGDSVLSYNTESGQVVPAEVQRLESPVRDHHYVVEFEGGSTLNLTNEHPIRIIKSGLEVWGAIEPQLSRLPCERIAVGDEAVTIADPKRIVAMRKMPGDVQTYNLAQVAGTHTFFADGVLVHNKKNPESITPNFGSGGLGGGVVIENLIVYANGNGDVGDAIYRDVSAKLKLLTAK